MATTIENQLKEAFGTEAANNLVVPEMGVVVVILAYNEALRFPYFLEHYRRARSMLGSKSRVIGSYKLESADSAILCVGRSGIRNAPSLMQNRPSGYTQCTRTDDFDLLQAFEY